MSTLIIPLQTKTWCVLSNVAVGGLGNGATDYKDFHLKLKKILTNHTDYASSWKDTHGVNIAAPMGCVVTYSCNGSGNAAYCGAADYINSLTDVVSAAAGANHSYWVLTFPGISANFELLWDFAGGTAYSQVNNPAEAGGIPSGSQQGGYYASHTGGFAANGGIITRRCWSVGETQILNRRAPNSTPVYLGGLSTSSDWSGKLHVCRTSDGSCTRVVFCQNGVPIFFFYLEVPGAPFHTNGTPDHIWNTEDVPWFSAVYGSTSLVNAGLYNGTPGWVVGNTTNLMTRIASFINPTTNALAGLEPVVPWSSCFGDVLISVNASAANAGDGGYTPLPMGLAVSLAGYTQPWLGTWQDIYLIGNNLTDGSSGAEDTLTSGYSWRKFGNFLWPWDRSACQMS